AGIGPHVWNCRLRRAAAYRSDGPENPQAQTDPSLHNDRRRVSWGSRERGADRNASTTPTWVFGCRLVASRPALSGKLLGHGPRIRIQYALSSGAFQHALPFWARPRHWVSKGHR